MTTVKEALQQLKALGNEKTAAQNRRQGAGDAQFGVPLGDIRKLAAKIKADAELATALWKTGNLDAQLLAILLLKPKDLSSADLDRMVRSVAFANVADWFVAYIVKKHADKETLRQKWMVADDPWAARAGWGLTHELIERSPAGLDLPGLVHRIESEMGSAPPEAQWTMNFCLIAIGTNFPEHRQRAMAIGEKLGLYRDYPVSKGCTSPFAPIAITELAKRKG